MGRARWRRGEGVRGARGGAARAESEFKFVRAQMARTQKNKATEHHLGLLKAKLAKLKAELLTGGKGGGGKAGDGFDVAKAGDTRVGLVGFPSVGKSTLLTKLTGTESLAAAYEFTTLTAIPGTLHYRGARIQILDLPGIIEGAKDGKGRGRQVIAAARTCNVIMIVLDASKPLTVKKVLERELEGFGIRLNKSPPDIVIKKKDKGGVTYRAFGPQEHLTEEIVRAICSEYRMPNADVVVRQENATVDDLIDVIDGTRTYIPCMYVLNKIDKICMEELDVICKHQHYVPISAQDEWNFDELLETMWDYCKMIRIYTKPRGQIPDYSAPVILHARRPRVEDFCNTIHRGIMAQFKHARVWGSGKFPGQAVGKDHVLDDEDVVQIIKK